MWMVDVFISKKSCKLMEIQLKGQNLCFPSLVPPAELESLLDYFWPPSLLFATPDIKTPVNFKIVFLFI